MRPSQAPTASATTTSAVLVPNDDANTVVMHQLKNLTKKGGRNTTAGQVMRTQQELPPNEQLSYADLEDNRAKESIYGSLRIKIEKARSRDCFKERHFKRQARSNLRAARHRISFLQKDEAQTASAVVCSQSD